jgi:hypothetical protein
MGWLSELTEAIATTSDTPFYGADKGPFPKIDWVKVIMGDTPLRRCIVCDAPCPADDVNCWNCDRIRKVEQAFAALAAERERDPDAYFAAKDLGD